MVRHPILFIRHGETDWNRVQRFQGRRDVPLNDHGRRQAARNGRAVAGILQARDWHLVASPLGRAMETMSIVLAAAGAEGRDVEQDARLVEVHYGDWEGLTLTEIGERFPDQAVARDADKWNYRPPNGESYAMLATRVAPWLASLTGPTFVVAHGGILRVLLQGLAGMPAEDVPHLFVEQDRVALFTDTAVLTI